MPSNVISIGAAATSDNISPISRLPLQEGAVLSYLSDICHHCYPNGKAGAYHVPKIDIPLPLSRSISALSFPYWQANVLAMMRYGFQQGESVGSIPDSNYNAVVGKVGCYIVARPSNAVIPFGHQQVPCTQNTGNKSAHEAKAGCEYHI